MSTIEIFPPSMLRTLLKRKPSFWDNLTEEERAASVNQSISRPFQGLTAWDAAGVIKDQWNQNIYPHVVKPLIRDNEARIFGNETRRLMPLIICWMVGSQWNLCRPAVVLVCSLPKVADRAIDLLQTSVDLTEFGFRYYHFNAPIRRNVGEHTGIENKNHECVGFCGTSIRIGFNFSRKATIGGVIEIEGESFGITAAHAFFTESEEELRQDNPLKRSEEQVLGVNVGFLQPKKASEPEDTNKSLKLPNEPDLGSIFLLPEPAVEDSFKPSAEHILGSRVYAFNKGDPRKKINKTESNTIGELSNDEITLVGRLSPGTTKLASSPYRGVMSTQLDWALVKLIDKELILNVVTLPDGTLLFPTKISQGFPKGRLWVTAGGRQATAVTVSETIGGYFSPEHGLQDVWTLNMKSEPGDCGAWAVDPNDESIFGSVVAGCDLLNITLLFSFKTIFEDIKRLFPSALLSQHAVSSLLVHGVENKNGAMVKDILPQVVKRKRGRELDDLLNRALVTATSLRDKDLVRLLLHHGAPLQEAVYRADQDTVRVLLEYGADVNRVNFKRETALHLASFHGYESIVKLLLEHGADVDRDSSKKETELHLAASHGYESIVKLLLEHGADVDQESPKEETALHLAAAHGYESVVKLLLEHGAGVDKGNRKGGTALHLAASHGYESIVKLLLDYGADVNSTSSGTSFASLALDNHHGGRTTPLIKAAAEGHRDIVKLLIANGANVDSITVTGWTALHAASSGGQTAIVRLLLDNGADVNMKGGRKGWSEFKTPLFEAARNGHIEIVRILLEKGAKAHEDDKIKIYNLGFYEIVDLLEENERNTSSTILS